MLKHPQRPNPCMYNHRQAARLQVSVPSSKSFAGGVFVDVLDFLYQINMEIDWNLQFALLFWRFFAEVALLMTHLCQYWYTWRQSPIDNTIPISQANIQSIIQFHCHEKCVTHDFGYCTARDEAGRRTMMPKNYPPETSIAPKNGGFQ